MAFTKEESVPLSKNVKKQFDQSNSAQTASVSVSKDSFEDLIAELRSNAEQLSGFPSTNTKDKALRLEASIEQCANSRDADNVHELTSALYDILNGYRFHRYGLTEAVWCDSVTKMKALSEESANQTNINAKACSLAGRIAEIFWSYFSWATSGVGPVARQNLSNLKFEVLIEEDEDSALKWFNKGANLGDETCQYLADSLTGKKEQHRPDLKPI